MTLARAPIARAVVATWAGATVWRRRRGARGLEVWLHVRNPGPRAVHCGVWLGRRVRVHWFWLPPGEAATAPVAPLSPGTRAVRVFGVGLVVTGYAVEARP